jgi:hypothetical protein
MNEQIKKIAEQYKDEIKDGFEGYDVVHWCNVEDLIHDVVRECIAHCTNLDSMQYIAQHFGVKVEGLDE